MKIIKISCWRLCATVVDFRFFISILIWLLAVSCGSDKTSADRPTANVVKPTANVVKVVEVPGGFRLERNGKPYRIQGAGGTKYFDQLREAGGNSIRLWSADYAEPLLDEAQRQGLTVMLGLWLEPDGKGVDYYDRTSVQTQLQRLRVQVLRFRNHPALLMWNVGNELDLTESNPKMFMAINEVAVMIHELDPNHPVTTSIVYVVNTAPALSHWAPAIDILSINAYAPLLDVPQVLSKSGWKGPYIITEFGPKGYWEATKTPWDAPLEQTSAVKAAFTATRFRRTIIADSARCLGSYIFFWGNKFEQNHTWFNIFTQTGEKTTMVDTLTYLWRGTRPANLAPTISRMELAGKRDVNFPRLKTNTDYFATFIASDNENDPLTADWELRPETPPEHTLDEGSAGEPLTGYLRVTATRGATLHTPRKPGAYRLFLVVHDGRGGAATANIPFYCADPKTRFD